MSENKVKVPEEWHLLLAFMRMHTGAYMRSHIRSYTETEQELGVKS